MGQVLEYIKNNMKNNTLNINVATGEITKSYTEELIVNDNVIIDYDAEVNKLIRLKYTSSQEFAMLRQQYDKPDEFNIYFEYCEWCKNEIKNNM